MAKKKFVRRVLMNNDSLQTLCEGLNHRFFDSKINPAVRAKYVPGELLRDSYKKAAVDALWNPTKQEIWIDEYYAVSQDLTCILLLHEMAHAALQGKYVGHSTAHPGHGMVYQAELFRLIMAGAYDGIL